MKGNLDKMQEKSSAKNKPEAAVSAKSSTTKATGSSAKKGVKEKTSASSKKETKPTAAKKLPKVGP